MVAVYSGGDFKSLEAEIERCEKRGDTEDADTLRKHLAKLLAMQSQVEVITEARARSEAKT